MYSYPWASIVAMFLDLELIVSQAVENVKNKARINAFSIYGVPHAQVFNYMNIAFPNAS